MTYHHTKLFKPSPNHAIQICVTCGESFDAPTNSRGTHATTCDNACRKALLNHSRRVWHPGTNRDIPDDPAPTDHPLRHMTTGHHEAAGIRLAMQEIEP